ncbi:CU044_2847 family protein [Streptomyces werraensis]|uniref:CU044_2847 family protein n=1 Tax=Streptomyces werraensis TaxID=68284 RepID=UPI00333321CB
MAAHDAESDVEGTVLLDADGGQLMLVDFPAGRGVRQVALGPGDLVRRSEEAVNAAMGTIRGMAQRVGDAVSGLPCSPDQVEVEFGITLDAESGALIAKAAAGASLTVRLLWEADRP